jgi:vitamin B12 transporter
MIRKIAAFIPVLLLSTVSRSQQLKPDSVYLLREISIVSPMAYKPAAGHKTDTIDSAVIRQYRGGSVADLLSDQSLITIKTYGNGGLATPSFRGTSASHTAVTWNGVNLVSPLYGQLDLALLPVLFTDKVSLQYGGNGVVYGSGSVGGVISLSNDLRFGEGTTAEAGIVTGSFGMRQPQAGFALSRSRWVSSVKAFAHTARNDFPFVNTALAGSPVLRLRNAEIGQYGIMQENAVKLSEKDRLSLSVWYQRSRREIPPVMTRLNEVSLQEDRFLRSLLEWKHSSTKYETFLRAAYFSELLDYSDSLSGIRSRSTAVTFLSELEGRVSAGKGQLLSFLAGFTGREGGSDGYASVKTRSNIYLNASYRVHAFSDRLIMQAGVREEIWDGKLIPFTFSAGSDLHLRRNIALNFSVSRLFRLPTFNDLFWTPGGNPGLSPESGWNQELGLTFREKRPSWHFKANAALFSSRINNLIVWLSEGSFWSPRNVMQVWSRGLETMWELGSVFRKISWMTRLQTGYTLSTNEKTGHSSDGSLGKQLIYIPVYQVTGTFRLGIGRSLFSYAHSYAGYRYTTTDNSLYMEPYQVANLSVSYLLSSERLEWLLLTKISNLWDETYQVIEWRPMPGRNYQLGLTLKFKQPKTNIK